LTRVEALREKALRKGVSEKVFQTVESLALDRMATPPRPGASTPGVNAMNLQMTESAQPARGVSLCEFCRRPWFGLVAYCPYCGRKPSCFTAISQEPDDCPQIEEALASGQRPTPSQLNKPALTLLFKTVVAGVSALLLFWMVVKLPAPRTNEAASPQLPISTSNIASPMRGPSTSAAQVPSIPLRTDTAVPPQSNRRSLCSVANEAAGLCKSQE